MYTRPEDDNSSPEDPSRPRRMTVYQTREGRPRWVLHMQAVFWRVLMGLGMFFHKLALPRPPKPDFYREIPSTISGKPGKINLYFYVPRDYATQRRLYVNRPELDDEQDNCDDDETIRQAESSEDSLGKMQSEQSRQSRRVSIASNVGRSIRRLSGSARLWGGYPVVINFHGGGFTLGRADDDARWCGTVVDECHAVVVSVDYRLAPEHPFPTAVEDGVDAVLYIHQHAEELGIDKDKIALSGFSSGANMAFTVPLRLYDEMTGFPRDDAPPRSPTPRHAAERALNGAAPHKAIEEELSASSSSHPTSSHSKPELLDPNTPLPTISSTTAKPTQTSTITSQPLRDVSIRMLVPWYPPVDYTRTREQRRATSARKDQELPAIFTDLFDESYLHPPNTISLDSPYLSPGVAPASLLKNALPREIILHTCEWDMLLNEGQAFHERLISPEIGKKVWYKMIEGVPHGWDKAPNPWKPTPGVREHYLRACKEMRRVFGAEKGQVRPVVERSTTKGYPTAAPRGSVQVVR